jgi:hypothetical protein
VVDFKMKSVPSPKKNSSTDTIPVFSALADRPRKVLLTGLILFFLLLAMNTLFLAYYIYQPEISSFLYKPSPNLDPTAASQAVLNTPTETPTQAPLCTGLILQVGPASWRIASLERASDGSVNIPDDTAGIAYWVRDPGTVYVFALSPTQGNLDLFATLQGDEQAILTSEDCDAVEYILSAPQPGEPNQQGSAGQSASAITIYIPGSSTASGEFIQGELVGVTIASLAGSEPAPPDPKVEISLLSIYTPSNGQHLQVVISILNAGTPPITVSNSDFILTPQGAPELALIQSYPSLPTKISPDEVITFNLVFPRPSTPTATLKILSQSFDLNGY